MCTADGAKAPGSAATPGTEFAGFDRSEVAQLAACAVTLLRNGLAAGVFENAPEFRADVVGLVGEPRSDLMERLDRARNCEAIDLSAEDAALFSPAEPFAVLELIATGDLAEGTDGEMRAWIDDGDQTRRTPPPLEAGRVYLIDSVQADGVTAWFVWSKRFNRCYGIDTESSRG